MWGNTLAINGALKAKKKKEKGTNMRAKVKLNSQLS